MSVAGRAALWLLVLSAAVGALVALRGALEQAHVALLLLTVVLGASAHGGRVLGFSVAGLAFVAFNWWFMEPVGTLVVADPRDWLVLIAFLGAALLAGQLLHRAQTAAQRASALAVERERLSREREALLLRSRDAELHAAQSRAKDEVLASVSHDLRTPLTAIRALAHELASSGDERALAIEEEAAHLGQFVADVLDLSRLHAGALPIDLQANEAEDLIGSAIQRVSAAHPGRQVQVTLDHGEPLLFARCDWGQTVRVLANLLDNAFRHARDPVEIHGGRRGAWLELVVADRGPGVPPAMRPRLFEPFVRGPEGDRGGTGLGLSIVRGLMEAQGGTVGHAERDGGGSLFVLRLPALDVTATTEAPPPSRILHAD